MLEAWGNLLYRWSTLRSETKIYLVHPLVVGSAGLLMNLAGNLSSYIYMTCLLLLVPALFQWFEYVKNLKGGMRTCKYDSLPAVLLNLAKLKGCDFKSPVIELVDKNNVGRRVKESGNGNPFISFGEEFGEVKFDRYKWLNDSIEHVWRAQRAAMEDIIQNVVWPNARKGLKDLPVNLSIELYELNLGMIAPKFDKIKVLETRDDIIMMDIDISFPSEASVKVKVKTDVIPKVMMEINSLYISVSFRVMVRGLNHEPPYVTGVELSLKRTPTVHWRLGATAKVANINLIDELVRELVRDNTKMLVLPNRLSIPYCMLPLAQCEGDETCRMIIPRPEGVVRICVEKTAGLPAKDYTSSLLSPLTLFTRPATFFKELKPARRTSDVYLEIKIGSSQFKSKVHYKRKDPVFNLTCDIPVDCPLDRELILNFSDEDSLSSDDFIGFLREDLQYIKESCSGEMTKSWRGLGCTTGAYALLGYRWIPLHLPTQGETERHGNGVISFSILEVFSSQPCKPRIKLSLPTKEDSEDEYLTARTWESIMPFKDRANFKLCQLSEPDWDLFMLQGGMLRLLSEDNELEVELTDLLERLDESGTRQWRAFINIADIIKAESEPVLLHLEKGFTVHQNLVSRTRKQVRVQINNVIDNKTGKLRSEFGETLRMKIQFSVRLDR